MAIMNKEKMLYSLLCLLPLCKITDVFIALVCSIGKVSFEWDGAYYVLIGFVNQDLFKEDKLALLSIIIMLLMTTFSVLVKYKLIF
jgi:hypothetical protein